MDVRIIAQEFSLTPSLRERLDRRLRYAFSHTSNKVMRIIVRLRDLNGPRGGPDKVCQVSITMPGRAELRVREVHEDLYTAIDRAVRRAANSAMRVMTRRRPAHSMKRQRVAEGDDLPADSTGTMQA